MGEKAMNEKEKERIKSLFAEMNKVKKDIDESKLEAEEKVQKVKENKDRDLDDILAFIHNRKNPTRKTEEEKGSPARFSGRTYPR